MKETYEWVLVLKKNNWHAKGLAVVKKVTGVYGGEPYSQFKYGDFTVFDDQIIKMWPLDSIKLDWIDFIQPYKPTFIEKLKCLFFGKGYPSTTKVRPKNNSLVIMQYNGCEHIEVAEYCNKNWITDLWFPSQCSKWAYIPEEIINEADNK